MPCCDVMCRGLPSSCAALCCSSGWMCQLRWCLLVRGCAHKLQLCKTASTPFLSPRDLLPLLRVPPAPHTYCSQGRAARAPLRAAVPVRAVPGPAAQVVERQRHPQAHRRDTGGHGQGGPGVPQVCCGGRTVLAQPGRVLLVTTARCEFMMRGAGVGYGVVWCGVGT